MPDNLTTITAGMFNGCLKLKNLNTDNITTIGDEAFAHAFTPTADSLVNLKFPRIVSIGELAFYTTPYNSSSLDYMSLSFGPGLTSIGDYAFADTNKYNVNFYGLTPPTTSSTAFYESTQLKYIIVNVPKGCYLIYKNTPGFSTISANHLVASL